MSGVLIIGSGLSALCLAQGLKERGIDFTVFEKDESLHHRGQGYRLRLAGGAHALKHAVSTKTFERIEETCAPYQVAYGATVDAVSGEPMRPFVGDQTRGLGGPGIAAAQKERLGQTRLPFVVDRRVLREVLMLGIGDQVRFGSRFIRYEVHNGYVTAHFADGTSARGRLLVGADGRFSRVRAQLDPGHNLIDAGGRAFYGKIALTPTVQAILNRHGINGLSLLRDSTTRPCATTMLIDPVVWPATSRAATPSNVNIPSDYVYWVCTSRLTSFPLTDQTLLELSNEDACKLSKFMFRHWHQDFRELLEQQVEAETAVFAFRSVRPDMSLWAPSQYVTMIGDAVHAMPPMRGSGANTALQDADNLLRAIDKSGGLHGLTADYIRAFEHDMVKNAMEALKETYQEAEQSFAQKSLQEVLASAGR